MGKLVYVRKGENRYKIFKTQQKLKKKIDKEDEEKSFFYPKKVYGRRTSKRVVKTSKRKGRKAGTGGRVGVVGIFGRIVSSRRRR